MAWNDIGKSEGGGGRPDILELKDGQNRIRLLIPETGPKSWWNYAISCPNDDYRSWVSPSKEQDFFATNRKIFKATPRHAGHVWDYVTNSVKVLEAGNLIWEQIKNWIDAGINIYNRDIIITKKGEKRQTDYAVIYLDPAPFQYAPTTDQFINLDELYQAPTFEQVCEDLKALGFINPIEIFTLHPMSEQEALSTEVPFGQHKGKTIEQIWRVASDYILFLATKVDRQDIKEAARIVANRYMGTEYPLLGVAPAMAGVTFRPPAPQASAPPTPPPPPPPPAQPPYAPPAQTSVPPWESPPAQQPPAPPQQAWGQMAGGQQFPGQAPPAPPAAPAWTPPVPQAPPAAPPAWAPPAQAPQTPPPAPPAQAWTPPTPQAPPAPPAPPAPLSTPSTPTAYGMDRNATIASINAAFEGQPKYKDFMLIIQAMKDASAPHGKTSINEFADEELMRLHSIVTTQ